MVYQIFNKTTEELIEEDNILNHGYKRNPNRVLSEINKICEDIWTNNGDLNGERKCLDCGCLITWNTYHPLCKTTNIMKSQNSVDQMILKMYQREWIMVKNPSKTQDLATETDYFKKNKHWLISFRYHICSKWWEHNKANVLRNPSKKRWPMNISYFKPVILDIIDKVEKDFEKIHLKITKEEIYNDIYNCFMIRKNQSGQYQDFEVRSNYRPSEAVDRKTFVKAWSLA